MYFQKKAATKTRAPSDTGTGRRKAKEINRKESKARNIRQFVRNSSRSTREKRSSRRNFELDIVSDIVGKYAK